MNRQTSAPPRRARVLLACCGLGTVRRGYETFMQHCFDILRQDGRLDLTLCKGAGPTGEAVRNVPHLSRTGTAAAMICRFARLNPYRTEQFTFFLGLLPRLLRSPPDVLYVSDELLARGCLHLARKCGHRFRVLFRNGAPAKTPYPAFHHIHQMTPVEYRRGLRSGFDERQMTLIPNAIPARTPYVPPSADAKRATRQELGLPEDRPVILSVVAADPFKRLPDLVHEVSRIQERRPFLVNLGEQDRAMRDVARVAIVALGEDGFATRSVPPPIVTKYYRAVDLLVHPAVKDCAPRVLAEAASEGLLVAAHDGEVQRFVLGRHGHYADFRTPGTCSDLISHLLRQDQRPEDMLARHEDAFERFSWHRLAESYVRMLLQVAGFAAGT